MDVRAENRGHPHQKVRFPAAPVVGELLTPWASGRKGQECPWEIRTKKFLFMLFFSSLKLEGKKTDSKHPEIQKITQRLHELFRELRANFCRDMSQEPSRNCSEKNLFRRFFHFRWIWGVDSSSEATGFLCQIRIAETPIETYTDLKSSETNLENPKFYAASISYYL